MPHHDERRGVGGGGRVDAAQVTRLQSRIAQEKPPLHRLLLHGPVVVHLEDPVLRSDAA